MPPCPGRPRRDWQRASWRPRPLAVLLVSASALTPQRPLPSPPPPRGPVTSAEAVEMVQAHNAWRTRAGVLSLRWAADLAAQAQNRALQLARQDCALEHGMLPDDVGENLYRAGALTGNSAAPPSTSCRRRKSSMPGAWSRPIIPLPRLPARRTPVRPLHPGRVAVDRGSRLRHGRLRVARAGLGLPLSPARQRPRSQEIAKHRVNPRRLPS